MNISKIINAFSAKFLTNPPTKAAPDYAQIPGILPDDLLEFYSITDGAIVLVDDNPSLKWRIFRLGTRHIADYDFYGGKEQFEFEKAHDVCHPMFETCILLASDGDWFLILDLHPTRHGLCYAATTTMHFMWEDVLVANSFSEWLEKMVTMPANPLYWEAPDFPQISAYP